MEKLKSRRKSEISGGRPAKKKIIVIFYCGSVWGNFRRLGIKKDLLFYVTFLAVSKNVIIPGIR
jgi:hypothetical protein